jgi:hypothetical protein
VIPQGTPKVVKNCPKCGGGSHFINTKKFRVNANKKYLDIWLIYQCEKCKFIYKTEKIAKKCEAWCKKYNSCNLNIIRHAIES